MRARQDAVPVGADTLALGDIVSFHGVRWLVTAFQGARVFMAAERDAAVEPLIILQTALTSAQDFAILNRAARRTQITRRSHELQAVPTALRREVERWENIVKEVLHQQAPNVPATKPPKPNFDPKRHSLKDRYRTKAAQMTAAGWTTSAATVERKCRAWRKDGLLGLVDRRSQRAASTHGRVDARVIEVVWELLDSERREGVSPGTMSRLIGRVQRTVRTRYASELAVADQAKRAALLPSQATFYRLLGRLGISADTAHTVAARRAAGPPRTAGRPDMRPATMARWPGELVQIDTTGLDVLVLSDDGKTISVELTIAIDVATRSIVGSLIVPKRFRREAGAGRWLGGRATRSFDTLQVVAQATAPLPVRPGWAPETFMEGSDLPYEELLAVDERFAGAAARPVIRPETLVVDHGSPFVSADFTRSCNAAGIEVREARLRTAIDKAVVERAMRAIKTGFSQYLAVYTHHRLALRGRRVRQQPLFTIAQLQDLFEQWVVLRWQQTSHGGLRSPFTPGLKLTPNEMYAALIFLRGYRSTALSEGENRKLLPTVWVRVNRKGFQINNRTYNLDHGGLDPFLDSSGLAAVQGRWEVHYSPNAPEVAWLFDHRASTPAQEWVEVPFIHRRLLTDPWTEEAWERGVLVHLSGGGRRGDQPGIARATQRLLDELAAGPRNDQRPAAAQRSRPAPRRQVAALEPYGVGVAPPDPQSVQPFPQPANLLAAVRTSASPATGNGQDVDVESFLVSHPEPRPPADGPLSQQGDDR
ncbi:integrase [Streptomyces microflavus]|uniref:integrase n=1 Tax=Streptomyces microflavus TaxID=1919 RepID=UPI0034199A17